jgi:hypothetical protein
VQSLSARICNNVLDSRSWMVKAENATFAAIETLPVVP